MAETIGLNTASSIGTQIDSGASHTKPGFASGALGTASADFVAIDLQISDTETLNVDHLISVGVNGVAVAEDILFRGRTGGQVAQHPFRIPMGGSSGNVVAINAQTSGAAAWVDYSAVLLTSSDVSYTPSNVSSSYGATTATTKGVQLDPGGSANTESSPIELTTSGGLDEATDVITFCVVTDGDTTLQTGDFLIKVYTDATGSTDTGIGWQIKSNALIDLTVPMYYTAEVSRAVFAASTRVWLTVQSNITDATNRLLHATMIGYQIDQSAGGGGAIVNQGLHAIESGIVA